MSVRLAQASIGVMALLWAGDAAAACKYQNTIFHSCDGCTFENRAVITKGTACRINWGRSMGDIEIVSPPKKGSFEFTPSRLQSTYRPFSGATGDDYLEFRTVVKSENGTVAMRFKIHYSLQ